VTTRPDVDARSRNAHILAGRFVVVALAIVLAVPHRLVLQELIGLLKNAQVVNRDRLVAAPVRESSASLRSLPRA
jgi:hypothetical protein